MLTEEMVQTNVANIVRSMAVNEITRVANKATGVEQKKLIALAEDASKGRYSFSYRTFDITRGINRDLEKEPLVAVVIDLKHPDADNILHKFTGVLPVELEYMQ